MAGKTEEFSQQIEVHQKELAPWTAKVVAKQGEVDMAQSEHDLLQEKAKSMRSNFEQAEAALSALQSAQKSKEAEILELQESIEASADQIADMENKINVCLKG